MSHFFENGSIDIFSWMNRKWHILMLTNSFVMWWRHNKSFRKHEFNYNPWFNLSNLQFLPNQTFLLIVRRKKIYCIYTFYFLFKTFWLTPGLKHLISASRFGFEHFSSVRYLMKNELLCKSCIHESTYYAEFLFCTFLFFISTSKFQLKLIVLIFYHPRIFLFVFIWKREKYMIRFMNADKYF